MNARLRPALLGAAALAAAGLAAAGVSGRLSSPARPPAPPPAAAPAPLEVTPALVAQGEAIALRRCQHCHRDVPLAPRVRGWDVGRAYEALGRLEQLSPLMPPFRGPDGERRALAAYLASLGAP